MNNNVSTLTKAKTKLIPKLRFPEFWNMPEWEKKKIGDFASFHKGKGISKADIYSTGKTFCIRYGELYTRYNEIINKVFSKTDCLISDLFLSRKNDIILPASGETKLDIARASCVMLDNIALGSDLNIIRSSLNGIFFSYYLNGPIKKDIAKVAQGDTVVHLYLSQLKEIEVQIPDNAEQQKIADCLSSIDELIALQTQKIDLLKIYKKGLMQQLFPSEGETMPKLRFPEFQDVLNWKKKNLGSLSEILRGGSPRPIEDFLTTDKNGLNWLKIGDVNKNSKYVTSTQYKVRPEALSKTREVYPGDLILSNSMSFGRPYILKIKSCIHDGWIAVTKIDDQINRNYLYYIITSSISQSYFSDNAAGSGVQNLNADIIKLLPILFPKISEQRKIADCLSCLDDLITLQIQKIDLLKAHKKGLMQQLFPSLEETNN